MVLRTRGEVFAVNVNWNSGNGQWNVNVWRLDDNTWNAGNRVVSPETPGVLPHSSCGSFRFKSFLPPANHSTEFFRLLRKEYVFLVVERIQFPCYTQEEFQKIDLAHGGKDRWKFFILALIACHEEAFKNVHKRRIYSVTERVARAFWKIASICIPQLVY